MITSSLPPPPQITSSHPAYSLCPGLLYSQAWQRYVVKTGHCISFTICYFYGETILGEHKFYPGDPCPGLPSRKAGPGLVWQMHRPRPQSATEAGADSPVHHWGRAPCHTGPLYQTVSEEGCRQILPTHMTAK